MPSQDLDQLLAPTLAQAKAANLYRQPKVTQRLSATDVVVDGKSATCFCSNDYLGLATHPKIRKAMQSGGSGAAHLISGHSPEHHALEEELADFLGKPRALLFSTGYMANVGVIDAITHSGEWTIHSDELNHASLIDGCRLSKANTKRYRHNDIAQLHSQLQPDSNLIVTDGVFSMDGDLAALKQLSGLPAHLMVDDAHGFGVLGSQGRGTVNHLGANQQVPIIMATFGKAVGTFGAFITGSDALIEYLIQRCRTYIYTTASPPGQAAATRVALQLVQQDEWRRDKLQTLIQRFRSGCSELGIQTSNSGTPIQPIILGDAEKTLDASQELLKQGIWVGAIRPPTVPQGTARLRITLSAEHSEHDVDRLLNALELACD
jgi:8-amino-7-oxononanoate synthase